MCTVTGCRHRQVPIFPLGVAPCDSDLDRTQGSYPHVQITADPTEGVVMVYAGVGVQV